MQFFTLMFINNGALQKELKFKNTWDPILREAKHYYRNRFLKGTYGRASRRLRTEFTAYRNIDVDGICNFETPLDPARQWSVH